MLLYVGSLIAPTCLLADNPPLEEGDGSALETFLKSYKGLGGVFSISLFPPTNFQRFPRLPACLALAEDK
jgi:hypothetical protein